MSYDLGKKHYSGKNILVLGLAKSGVAAAKLLYRFGAHIIVNDRNPMEKCQGVDELQDMGIQVICGHHPLELVHSGLDYVVKNPGIPYSSPPIQRAVKLEIPVITEIEIAYHISSAPIIGITGSNGKTTTTTLVGEILNESGISCKVAGNIGTVLSEVAVEAAESEWLVAELSSFQLAGTEQFVPKIGSILNVYPAHLDYHGTIDHYFHSKMKLVSNQSMNDIAVLNVDSAMVWENRDLISSRVFGFSRTKEVRQGMMIKDQTMIYKDESGDEYPILAEQEIALQGVHIENALAASLIAILAGAAFSAVKKVLSSFQGVEHRLEYVETVAGVRYFNDSKATNVCASLKALESFQEPIVYIAGGLDRGVDFMEFKTMFASGRVKGMVTYGETSDKFQKVAKEAGLSNVVPVDNVNEAVRIACGMAEYGDVVLLSPACASWDMYSSFEERGRIFKESVHKLKTSLS